MLNRGINFLRGSVTVAVEAPYPERVLNLCGSWGIPFWDLHWEGEQSFSFRLHRKDYRRLQRACRKLEVSFSVRRRAGAPYACRRLWRRGGLLWGMGACAFLLVLSSFFVWDFQVEGNRSLSEQEILRALAEEGVKQGCFAYGIDSEPLRNRILLKLPELSWLTVNVKGCRAYVQVRERVQVPEIWSKHEPANLVASKSGVVTRVQALDGTAAVLRGQTVLEGELLISGVRSGEVYGTSFMSGLGEVRARTWYELLVKVPMEQEIIVYDRKEQLRWAINFGGKRINFYRNSGIAYHNYDKISTRVQGSLFGGLVLPVTVIQERIRPYTVQTVPRTAQQAQTIGEETLLRYLDTLLCDGSVTSTRFSATQREDCLLVSLSAECEESIGRLQTIEQVEHEGEMAWSRESASSVWSRR